jgi:Tfp pilus assembly protein PilF
MINNSRCIFSLQLKTVSLLIFFAGCKNSETTEFQKQKSLSLSYQSEQFFASEELDSAAYYIGKALELEPRNHVAYNNRAHLYFKLDSPTNVVIREYDRALEIKPGYDVALASLANYYFEIQDYANALQQLINSFNWQKLDLYPRRTYRTCV